MKPIRRVSAFVLILVLLLTGSGMTALADSVLTLPAALEVIEEEAFYGATSIDKVVLSDNVSEIQAKAFAYSTVSEILLPRSVSFIDETAFEGCSSVIAKTYPGSYAEGYVNLHANMVNRSITNYSVSTGENADGSNVTRTNESWTETKVNADGSVTVTDGVKETVATEHGNEEVITTTEIVKSKTTFSVVHDDGTETEMTVVSKNETVTEIVSDGQFQVTTQTKTEQEKTTGVTRFENDDGSVTEITETQETETVTETVTGSDGTVYKTVTITEKEGTAEMLLKQDGSVSETSTVTSITKDDNNNVFSRTTYQSAITVHTESNGTIITETRTIESQMDDANNIVYQTTTVTTENKTPDGSTGTIIKDGAGNILSQETTISQEEFDRAMEESRPIQAPLIVDPATLAINGELPPIRITLPQSAYNMEGDGHVNPGERPKIEIQVTVRNYPPVVAEIGPDGTLRIIKDCYED